MRTVLVLLVLALAPSVAAATDAKVAATAPAAKAVVAPPPKAAPAPAASQPVAPKAASAAAPVDLPAPVPGEPTSAEEAIKDAAQVVAHAKARDWFSFSALIIFLVMFSLKALGLFTKIGKRWAYLILPVLGVAAMLLAKFAGGVSWAAAWVVLTSAPVAGLINDFFKRGVMGKDPETPLNPK